MREIDLLTHEWNDIPPELRPAAVAAARDRASRLALAWTGVPDEITYVERGLSGASRPDIARWAAKSLPVLRADFRVCHYVDACIRAQASFHRRKAPPRSARKLVQWVKRTRADLNACRSILIDLHCGTPPFNRAGPLEREALRKMMEAVRRENERAEMLLLAMAFYPAARLEKREASGELEGLGLRTLPGETVTPSGGAAPDEIEAPVRGLLL
jgi:hypothetical protein